MSGVQDYSEIVPKGAKKARGIDFCGTHDYYYIVRSDLGVYLKSTNFHEGNDIIIYPLNESCRWGDHYFGSYDDDNGINYFFIVKGDEYRRVTNMAEDAHPEVFSLHPNCRGVSYYYAAFGHYYIVFADRKVYRKVKNMTTDEDPHVYNIHEAFQDGIYFWGVTDYVYCLNQADKWGVQYHKSTNMHENDNPETYSVHESVLNFLPGGLAYTKGKAFGYWDKLKSFENDTDVAVDWKRTIKKSVGFTKSKMSSIERHWDVKLGVKYSPGLLTEAIAKYQFSLEVQFGGTSTNTEQEEWSETTEISETINLQIPPKSQTSVWQYQMGFGEEKSLFCKELKITENANPPVDLPQSIGKA